MMAYNLCLKLISLYKGKTDKLIGLRDKADIYYAADSMTDDEYVDIMSKIQEALDE